MEPSRRTFAGAAGGKPAGTSPQGARGPPSSSAAAGRAGPRAPRAGGTADPIFAFEPGPGQGPYAAAKAGIIGYTHSLALDLAESGVTVNAIAPGLIWHDRLERALSREDRADWDRRTPMKRAGEPREIAETVAFLLSDGASYITGQTIHVNGGSYLT